LKSLEEYFTQFHDLVIGHNAKFNTPYGNKELIYADWTASGRLYKNIEEAISNQFGPFVGNTHTETSVTGTAMTIAYHLARKKIKEHVHASEKDIIISSGSGMTRVLTKLQRILGLKICEKLEEYCNIPDEKRPVVFVTHMEHHSNHTSWLETICDVVCIQPDKNGLPDLEHLKSLLKEYAHKEMKIASVTACSNVTGISAPYYEIAEIMHAHKGYCFVDFACSAPYVKIDMHPENPEQRLDAIFFSPHKFLGGPGSTGILVFNQELYCNKIPDVPGGGTVAWTNPWGGHRYFDDIEVREDGGTPAFLQSIRAALSIHLKEKMGVENMMKREEEIVERSFDVLENIPNLYVLAPHVRKRLALFSFYIDELHYNLGVRMLNDRFGIQCRGGCSCAGTYGHYLLNVSEEISKSITDSIDSGDLSLKPGWIRISFHPIMKNREIDYVLNAVKELALNHKEWAKDYICNPRTNEFYHKDGKERELYMLQNWFDI
jgi:selenocysteine lyase/cysteine desulfurase